MRTLLKSIFSRRIPVTLCLSGKLQLSSIVKKTYPNSSSPKLFKASACTKYRMFRYQDTFSITSYFVDLCTKPAPELFYTWAMICPSLPGPKKVFQEDHPIGGVG